MVKHMTKWTCQPSLPDAPPQSLIQILELPAAQTQREDLGLSSTHMEEDCFLLFQKEMKESKLLSDKSFDRVTLPS